MRGRPARASRRALVLLRRWLGPYELVHIPSPVCCEHDAVLLAEAVKFWLDMVRMALVLVNGWDNGSSLEELLKTRCDKSRLL